LKWSGEGESAYGPVDLRFTSPYCRKSRLCVGAGDGGLELIALLTYHCQTKHGIYTCTSSNLLNVAHYMLHR
jgi:hypothetical protein